VEALASPERHVGSTRQMKLIAAIILCLMIVSPSYADSDYAECFQKLHNPFQSWNAFFDFREKGECLSGAVLAEMWAEHITLLLADHWQLLPQLDSLAPLGSEKRALVLKYIDVSCPLDRCEKIRQSCKNSCPSGLDELCGQILERINTAE
jgi:hypothetical protein